MQATSDRTRQHRGRCNHLAGEAAEHSVAMAYDRRGCATAARRWRGQSGEIDLIVRDGDTIVFVEVKKSRSFAQAAARVTRRQADRICRAAMEYVAGEPTGQLTRMRFDVGLVDSVGAVRIVPNAFGGW
ncbi:YraN family protein [Loktanella sp. TSTF-M6]|uniref:UPF0102 protein LGQ03_13900 n=1 Tax=Loktanella gaetbuli TaxID=2881335 RepID=A0ABS8BX61_9RHOB|nr:YraN family protein [Loktanella gaetbuli]MCB5200337.1 YraN family protein [Loktanella gaetbuli]